MVNNWIDNLPLGDRKALEELGFIKPKIKIHRHRCLSCGKVTKYVFCPKCYKERRAQYVCPKCGKSLEVNHNSAQCHECEMVFPLSYFDKEEQ